jgi:hypothetical protein
MAKIPILQSQVTPNVPEIVPAKVEQFTAGGKLFSEVGQQLNQISQQFEKVDTLRRTTQARNDLFVDLDVIANEASLDLNPDALPKYQKKIEEAIAKRAEMVPSGLTREMTAEQFRMDGYQRFVGLRNDFRKKKIVAQQDVMIVDLNNHKNQYLGSVDPSVKEKSVNDALGSINNNIALGIIDKSSGDKLKDQVNSWSLDEAKRDSLSNPDLLLSNDRAYYNISDKDYQTAVNVANRQKQTNKIVAERMLKETQQKNHVQAIKDVMQTTNFARMSPDEKAQRVEEAYGKLASGEWSPAFAGAYIENINNPKLETEMNANTLGYVESLFSAKTPDEGDKALINLLNASTSAEDLRDIVNVAVKLSPQDRLSVSAILKNFGANVSSLVEMQTGVNYDTVKNFFGKMLEGKKPREAMQEVNYENNIRENPQMQKYEVGGVYTESTSRGKMITFKVTGIDPQGEFIVEIMK